MSFSGFECAGFCLGAFLFDFLEVFLDPIFFFFEEFFYSAG